MKPGDARILVVDDEDPIRQVVRSALEGYAVDEAADGQTAMDMLRQFPYDVLLTDPALPGTGKEALFEEAHRLSPETVVIVMARPGDIRSAVDAVRRGASDFLPKPFQPAELVLRTERGMEERQLKRENDRMRNELGEKHRFSSLVGDSAPMRDVCNLIRLITRKTATVLVEGEPGTGKELVARVIHANSPRKDQPLVTIRCSAIPPHLFREEFSGRLAEARRGTLLLDKVSSLPIGLQIELLRALEDRELERNGGPVVVRIIATSGTDLAAAVGRGEFRSDLYGRLNVIPIRIPPLRQRRDDIPQLVAHFVQRYCAERALAPRQVSHDALYGLLDYDWPGNVRQLEHAVETAVALAADRPVLETRDFPLIAGRPGSDWERNGIVIPEGGIHFNTVISELEKRLILQSLKTARGNKKKAAELLHLKRTTFVEKLRKMKMRGDPPPKAGQ